MQTVNFEFPLGAMPEALHYIAAHSLIEPVGLHLYATMQWANDATPQVQATAQTTATPAQWHAYCEAFAQQCVALYDPATKTGECVGPTAWPFDLQYFKL